MMEKFLSLFSDIDIRIVYAAAAIVAIAGILSLIKKAIKLGIIVIAISLVITYGGNVLNEIKENYKFNMEGTTMQVTILDKSYSVDLLNVKEAIAQDVGNGNVRLELYDKQGNAYTQPIVMNRMIYQLIKGQADKYSIEIKEK